MSIDSINQVREQLHDAGIRDALMALSRREYFDHQEVTEENPPPPRANWDDVEEHALTLPSEAARLRAKIEEQRGGWRTAALVRWIESAEDVERRWREHMASADHERWLREGGPARLWDVLEARKQRHEAVGRSHGAAATQWLMDEMVRVYLKQEVA
jgi:hypothetical protein